MNSNQILDDINKGLALVLEGVALISPHGQIAQVQDDCKPNASNSSQKELILWVLSQRPQALAVTARDIYDYLIGAYPSHSFRLGSISSALSELTAEGRVTRVRLGKGTKPSLYQCRG